MHAFESALPLENMTLILKPYFGAVSTFNVQANVISIYEYARLALHHAMIKNEQVKIYDRHISSTFINAHLLDEAIIEALQQNELSIHLQPIVTIDYQAEIKAICKSAEVLLRWSNQEWQSISPARLIDVIYKKGFGKVFIRWLINNACQRCAELATTHKYDISLTINLSSTDLLDADLPELLAQSIALWQIPSKNLIIEITENDILVDEVRVSQVIDKIKLLGCKLALDDFGTGYSSMARLRNMPIDIVKVDQSFVRNIASSNQDKEIVRSIVKLAHSLEKEIVAEGVEDLACLDILKEMKCDKIQGYYFGKPMSFEEFILWLGNFESQQEANSKIY
jgi:EAL domain-containing protein (putative c-di-GMP-specific phosphodiesterase class I)